MPLTELQRAIARLLAKNRTHDSYLAGGAALHFAPNSKRYSNDIRRRGKYRPEDFTRLNLVHSVDLVANKKLWLTALDEAEHFVTTRPPSEVGALYYSKALHKFVMPAVEDEIALHYGSPGGVLPKFL